MSLFISLYIKGLPRGERFPMVLNHFVQRQAQDPFTRQSAAAFLEFSRHYPAWGNGFLKNLKVGYIRLPCFFMYEYFILHFQEDHLCFLSFGYCPTTMKYYN